MFVEKVIVLGYIPVIEIGNSKIEQDIKKKSKVKYCEIEAILTRGCNILDRTIDAENPERLNQKIKEQKKSKIGYKFTLHWLTLRLRQYLEKEILGLMYLGIKFN